jgi:hypothetical protein
VSEQPTPPAPDLDPAPAEEAGAADGGENKSKKDKGGKKKAVSGVETMFRVTYNNHVQLSGLADNKANMLVSINGLIISVLLAGIAPRLSEMSWSIAPALVLISGCAPSLVLAVLASKPRLKPSAISVEEVKSNRGNVLFFGEFRGMPLADFSESMHALIDDQQLLRDNLIRELYFMGEALEQKYRRLQIAYTAFLLGISGSIVLFVVLLLARRLGV